MANIYVVRGSEDGNIAAYTSAARAIGRALGYVGGSDTAQRRRMLNRALRIDGYVEASTVQQDAWRTEVSCSVERF